MASLTDDVMIQARARVGTRLAGKWRLDALLGAGGMGVVYAATHRNGHRVAIKMLHPALSIDGSVKGRFLREGYIANAVGHPGAVRVVDDDTAEDGAVFLVMELLEGESFGGRARKEGHRLPLAEVTAMASAVLETLAAAHEKGIFHRDIKPDNIFATHDGGVKLLDFGIARLADPTGVSFTGSGATMGTPAFMAPEQAMGDAEQVDGQSDLWALGATMFTLVAGRHVHEASSVNQQLVLAATRPAPRLLDAAPATPRALADVIDRALAFAKRDRFLTATGMRRALLEACASLGDGPASPAGGHASSPAGAFRPERAAGGPAPSAADASMALPATQDPLPALSGPPTATVPPLDLSVGPTPSSPTPPALTHRAPLAGPPGRAWLWGSLGGVAVAALSFGALLHAGTTPAPGGAAATAPGPGSGYGSAQQGSAAPLPAPIPGVPGVAADPAAPGVAADPSPPPADPAPPASSEPVAAPLASAGSSQQPAASRGASAPAPRASTDRPRIGQPGRPTLFDRRY
jgi:eukaryotic-like serine/threonine-protein kinase